MNGIEVYDKSDVDNIVAPIQQNAAEAKQVAESIDSRKLDKTDAVHEFEADRVRLSNLESNKADKSEIQQVVSNAIDATINTKVASITSDINHIVDNAIDDALEDYDTPAQTTQKTANAIDTALQDYDTPAQTTQKTADAIDTALQNYDNSNTVDQKIATAVATRPAAMTTSEATALINQYF
jgi:hypothetical protein